MKTWNMERIDFTELYDLVYNESETLCPVYGWQDFASEANPSCRALNPPSWAAVLTQTSPI